MKKPIIALPPRTGEQPGVGGTFILYRSYVDALIATGGAPMMCCDPDGVETYAEVACGLVLTGGESVHPHRFGEEIYNDTVNINLFRDEMELGLFHAFMARKKPILAICRGYQLANIALGGDIWQDIPAQQGLNLSLIHI